MDYWRWEASITDFRTRRVNGERKSSQHVYQQAQNLPIPDYIVFYSGPKLYEAYLDDYETIVAFEQLDAIEGLTPEEKLIHIEMSPISPRENSTVRIYNAKQSIELKKALFKADRW